jgi:hypothetical protein
MDDEDDYKPPFHWGDMGALLLAGAFSLFGLYLAVDLMLGGHPLAILFREPPKQEAAAPAQPAADVPFHALPGEVVISTKAGQPIKRPKPAQARPGPRKAAR